MSKNCSLLRACLEKTANRLKDDNPCFIYDPSKPKVRSSSGSCILDYVTDGGFFVKKFLVELCGVESSGKTTLCMHSAKAAIDRGWTGVFFDYEGTYDHEYAASIGLVQGENYDVVQPLTAEQGEWAVLDLLEGMKDGLKLDFFIFDSIAACKPSTMTEKKPDDPLIVGLHARYWGSWIDQLSKFAIRNNLAMLFTNQMRAKIPNQRSQFSLLNTGIAAGYNYFDTGVTTTGGNTIRHYMAARYVLAQSGQVKEKGYSNDVLEEGEDVASVATWCFCKNTKNKIGPPKRKCKFVIKYGYGVDDLLPMFEMLKKRGSLTMAGPWITIRFKEKEERFKGKKLCLEWMKANEKDIKDFLLDGRLDAADVILNDDNADNHVDVEKLFNLNDIDEAEEVIERKLDDVVV